MADTVTIGLKKESSDKSPAPTQKRADVQLTEEDLKQIAAGTTKTYKLAE